MTKTQVIETKQVEVPFSDTVYSSSSFKLQPMVASPQCLFKPDKLIFCVDTVIYSLFVSKFFVGCRSSLVNIKAQTVVSDFNNCWLFAIEIPQKSQIPSSPGIDLVAHIRVNVLMGSPYRSNIIITGSVFGQGAV